MSISAPNASILPFRIQQIQQPTAKDTGQQGHQQTEGFGDILKTLQEGGLDTDGKPLTDERMAEITQAFRALEAGVELQSAIHQYTLQVHIGDGALAFNARPIVGPAAAEFASNLIENAALGEGSAGATLVSGTSPDLAASAFSNISMEPEFLIRADDSRLSAARFSRAAAMAPNIAAGSAQAPVVPTAQTALQQQATQRAADTAQRISQTSGPQAQSGTAPSQQVQARAQLFAQLVAAASEYRVSVRGAQLTQADNDRLIADIRAALRSYGLADLPITLSASAGDA